MPSLSKDAQQLAHESAALKKALWHVMHLVEAGTRVEAERSFHAFAVQLQRHEQHETNVAEKGMNRFPFGER